MQKNSDIFRYVSPKVLKSLENHDGVTPRIQLITRISRVSPSGGPIDPNLRFQDLGQVFACDSHNKSYDFLNSN